MSTTYRVLRRAVDALVATEDAITKARQAHLTAQINLGAALRGCRERKGLSLRDTAKQLKVTASYLSDVELGRRGLSDGNLESLMAIVGPPTINDIVQAIQDAQKRPMPPGRIAAIDSAASREGKAPQSHTNPINP